MPVALATEALTTIARAAVIAGGLSGAPSTLHALATGRDPREGLRAAGTLLAPDDATAPTLNAAGLLAHALVSTLWAALLTPLLRKRRHPVAAGALAGLGIAALDLGVVARRHHPRIAALPAAPQVLDHVAFGALVGAAIATDRTRAT